MLSNQLVSPDPVPRESLLKVLPGSICLRNFAMTSSKIVRAFKEDIPRAAKRTSSKGTKYALMWSRICSTVASLPFWK